MLTVVQGFLLINNNHFLKEMPNVLCKFILKQ